MHCILNRIQICLVFFLSAGSFCVAQEAMVLPVDSTPLVIATDRGDVRYDVEIARTDEQKAKGLMHRRSFPADRAMLFSFGQEHIATMWMVNTPLPLDMIFLNGSGHIIHIVKNARPYSRNIISSVYPARFVIELNAGQVEAKELAPGQKVIHPAICDTCGG